MQVVEQIAALRLARRALMGQVGLVPTMGYLHAGHMALVEAARADNEQVIATIFVNPTQFAANEDLGSYPRDLERDLRLLEDAGVDLVFTPTPDVMYPARFQTYVSVEDVSQGREGGQRPGHFRGVATVVAKLFSLTLPDKAYFGQKDAQQVVVLRQMVCDLNFPLDVVVCPIVRADDGLALSSRNVYLSAEERQAALVLNTTLTHVATTYDEGERDPDTLRRLAAEMIESEALARLDYVSLADARTLQEAHEPTDAPLLLSVAAKVGKPRLLDNCLLPRSVNPTDVLGAG